MLRSAPVEPVEEPKLLIDQQPFRADYWARATAGDELLTELMQATTERQQRTKALAMTASYQSTFGTRSSFRQRSQTLDHLQDLALLLPVDDPRRAQLEKAISTLSAWTGATTSGPGSPAVRPLQRRRRGGVAGRPPFRSGSPPIGLDRARGGAPGELWRCHPGHVRRRSPPVAHADRRRSRQRRSRRACGPASATCTSTCWSSRTWTPTTSTGRSSCCSTRRRPSTTSGSTAGATCHLPAVAGRARCSTHSSPASRGTWRSTVA